MNGRPESDERLRALPKAHLHLHLDGAVRYETLREVCTERGIPTPAIPADAAYPTFAAFMDTITTTHAVLADPDGLFRVVGEIVVDNAEEGVVWVELSVWPGLFGSAGATALEVILEAGRQAAQRFGIGFGVMLAANRHESPNAALDVAHLAVRHADRGVVSFGLDGDEAGFGPAPFESAFAVAKDAGLLSTPHAGELRGPASVAAAVDLLQADRVLHGVRAIEDPDLVARLAERGVCLDVCPTSNLKLSVVSDIAAHPLPRLLDAGVPCSLNADDPLLFGSSVCGEYRIARDVLGLDDRALAAIARASIDHSAAPHEHRARALRGIDQWQSAAEGHRPS